MDTVTLGMLADAVRGELIGDVRDRSIKITGAVSDNRKCKPGDVFFAFIGENSDGHKYVSSALRAGASGAVISKEPEEMIPGKFYVLVSDTLEAAGKFATAYRRQFQIPVVGVTGSVGKTTTKDMIASVLSQRFETIKTEANYNNHIGVPRTLLRFGKATKAAVVEMGMNHAGEISRLVQEALPTIAVITNIGDAHIGNLGSRENIFRAKSEIFQGLEPGGLAVMNADDEYLPKLKENAKLQERFRFIWIGEAENADFRAVDIDDSRTDQMTFRAETPKGAFQVTVPAPGHHMIYPALTAAAIGQSLGLTEKQIVRGIASYQATAMRMETYHCGGNIVIYNDTYNANPQSMKAGLETLRRTGEDGKMRRIAVLGDMLELGDQEEKLHREIGSFVAQQKLDGLITVGKRAEWIADQAEKDGMKKDLIQSFANAAEAEQAVRNAVLKDTALYFKASHLLALEKLAASAKEQAEQI